ncbi:hypothetical protein GCM10011410_12510 [Hoyosella rhizosphaerae]|uniref:Uncharacterized protein n=1 Tax=Hoyosella rhizosphaerae TaxID=1755582 RepID=A0A916U6E5_9ACTN|nr:hypothetical protein GCM10011410_12510 [Hoyosella rhizosphaerae]
MTMDIKVREGIRQWPANLFLLGKNPETLWGTPSGSFATTSRPYTRQESHSSWFRWP